MSSLMFSGNTLPPTGFVSFVGAGPGAADLITVRGVRALQQAEVVIYDDLANRDLLSNCPRNVDATYVGKRAGRHSATQEEINWLLVSNTLAGRRVVRLKGGDPSIFGRLGEELQVLRASRVEFEIVPGITAA